MSRLGACSLLGKLTPLAEGVYFQRAAQQCELPQARCPYQKLVDFRYLNVMYPSALHAQHMMMRFDVAVIARDIVQKGHLARLSYLAEFVENSMDGGQRYVGMLAAHGGIDLVRAGMILGSQKGSYNGEPLRGYRDTALSASRDELTESSNGVPFMPRAIQQPELAHTQLLTLITTPTRT